MMPVGDGSESPAASSLRRAAKAGMSMMGVTSAMVAGVDPGAVVDRANKRPPKMAQIKSRKKANRSKQKMAAKSRSKNRK